MPKQTAFKSKRHDCLNFALVVFAGSCCTASLAFTLRNLNTNVNHKNSVVTTSRNKIVINYPRNADASMEMSSIGQDPDTDDKHDEFSTWVQSNLPDPPEDQISMIGDISCLFLYSFLDHIVNRMYDKYLNSPETVIMKSAMSAIETSTAAASDTRGSLPVWFDPLSSAPYGIVPLNSALPIEHHITYAPAISSVGSASVLMCSIWLLCGYLTEAFRFKNTLECSRSQVILITTKTWILSSILMIAIAYASDVLVGSIDNLHKITGLSRVDTDFIFDSLSVLLVWRFILSTFLGPPNDES